MSEIGEIMKRRSFLKTAGALFPVAALQSIALGLAQAPPRSGEIHLVGAGQDRFGESHSAGFSSIRFKVSSGDTCGALFIIEHDNLVKGGPPLHLHLYQDEWFYVIEGGVHCQVGECRHQLRPGDSVLGPRNVPHAFSAVGEKPGRMLIAFTPAGKMEQFFRDTAVPNPPKLDAEVFSRYEMKYVGPSPFAS
jgi:mannose-6-phosphate isomerase-like protein (cupin superfamily)